MDLILQAALGGLRTVSWTQVGTGALRPAAGRACLGGCVRGRVACLEERAFLCAGGGRRRHKGAAYVGRAWTHGGAAGRVPRMHGQRGCSTWPSALCGSWLLAPRGFRHRFGLGQLCLYPRQPSDLVHAQFARERYVGGMETFPPTYLK